MQRLSPVVVRWGTSLLKNPNIIRNTIVSCPSRNFHASTTLFAKAKSNKKVPAGESEDAPVVFLPDTKKLESSMTTKMNRLIEEFSRLRGGRASGDMFNHLYVEAYGSKIPLTEVLKITYCTVSHLDNIR